MKAGCALQVLAGCEMVGVVELPQSCPPEEQLETHASLCCSGVSGCVMPVHSAIAMRCYMLPSAFPWKEARLYLSPLDSDVM